MELTGAQRTRLRGIGQTLADTLWIGRDGPSAAVVADLGRLLAARELVKARFTGGQDSRVRAEQAETLATAAACTCLGTVGHTVLFWLPGPNGSRLLEPGDSPGHAASSPRATN